MTRRRNILASGLVALGTYVTRSYAQVASVCPTSDSEVCFKLNIPESTASSGNGDIFFQISAPASYGWAALGQGTGMIGANIFAIYTSADGNNVTLSPRSARDYQNVPGFNGDAEVTLLEGSGVSNGKMIANVRCSNCNSWAGDTADFTAGSGNWVFAYLSSNGPMDSDDQNAMFRKHETTGRFQWDYANAKGGNSVNPLVNVAPSGTATDGSSITSCVPRPTGATTGAVASTKTDDDEDNTSTGWRPYPGFPTASPTGRPWNNPHDKRQDINYCDDSPSNGNQGFIPIGFSNEMAVKRKILMAHGACAALAFVVLFPVGAILIRLASFSGLVWVHGAFQICAYLVYIVAFGLGVYLANEFKMLNNTHPIIGIAVFAALFFMPILGFLHHLSFKRTGHRSFWSYAHLWTGRLAITLGIINGGFGFRLADTMGLGSRSGMIAYSVVAGIMWLVWVAAAIIGERRRKAKRVERPPKYAEQSPGSNTALRDIPHPENGHYAPK